jgi:sec-independent protein translocase protein TatB
MDFLGIGPLELVFILIIALIILGPKDMVKAGRTIGRLLRNLITSPNWRAIQQTSREIRSLPTRLIREAGLEEMQKNLPTPEQLSHESGVDELKELDKSLSDWTTPPTIGNPPQPPENPSQESEEIPKED